MSPVSTHSLRLRQWLPMTVRYVEGLKPGHRGQQHRSNDFLVGSMVDDDANDVETRVSDLEKRLTLDTLESEMILHSLRTHGRKLAKKNAQPQVRDSDDDHECKPPFMPTSSSKGCLK